ncbi:MAG: ATPase, T2SS/T4P/T4SS family [Candidatus Hydrogenedentota bacterium]
MSKDSGAGEELVRQAVITQEELSSARAREKSSGTPWYRQLLQTGKIDFGSLNDVLNYEFHSKSSRESHMSLGEALLETNAITEEHLKEALEEQKRNGKLLGTVLLDNRFVTRESIAQALSVQYGMPYAELSKTRSDREALDAVPESMAKQKEFIPVRIEGDQLTVLISGPQSPERMKQIGIVLGMRIQPTITAVADMAAEIQKRYQGGLVAQVTPAAAPSTQPKTKAAKKSDPAQAKTETNKVETKTMSEVTVKEASRFDDIAREAQGVPVIKLVQTIIEGAVNSGATDVHLDPAEPEMRVRYRIDGVLHDIMSIPRDIEGAVVSRVKILSDVDITETRHPQDGHFGMGIGEREFDIRVATLPTFLGERVVLRLLDQSSVLSGVADLGLESDDEKALIQVIEQPYGMILVTGPTGSGKTTTLYSCLNQKNVMTDSIVTLEDPVEYQLSGINQVQIDADIDLTFANVLRAALRQDIDVLLVGEIRDADTARTAIRAAMTGHLVFSTLHTNDSIEAISTLRNMDIPSYLIASALTAVVAQRLVRKICPECKTHFVPPKTALKSIGLPETTKRLYRGKGCDACYGTGVKGRTGVFEVLEINFEVRTLITADASPEKIARAAKLKTIADRCRHKVKNGEVDPEEYLRVVRL